MRRSATFSLALFIIVGLVLTGCDSGGVGKEGADPDPGMRVLQDAVTLTVPAGAKTSDTASIEVNYVKLDGTPLVKTTGALKVASTKKGRSTPYVSTTFNVFYDRSVGTVVKDTLIFEGKKGGSQFTDTLGVTTSPGFIETDFSSSFIAGADYEDAQRDSMTTGGTSVSLVNGPINKVPDDTTNTPKGSNGVRYLEVNATSSGALTFKRRASAPDATQFTFLIKPSPNTDFTLTITFTEETGSGTATHSVELPIASADSWRKFSVGFDQLGNFNPVASRAGGNGPLTSIKFSADKAVTYQLDQLMMGAENATTVEIEDFERTTGAYGPPFCPPTFTSSSTVADRSDGFTSRGVKGTGCFGYNYGGGLSPPGIAYLDVQGSDVLSFWAKATAGDSLFVFLESPNGTGGFTLDNGKTVALPVDSWGKVEVPIDSLGDDPEVLQSAGLRNFGFEAAGNSPDFLIDDIKIMSTN